MLDALLEDLTSSIEIALGDDLVGIYLCGSAVTGDFDLNVSDVDLVVVTAPEADQLDLGGLDRMHRAFVERHAEWNDRIEVVYVGRATLASFRSNRGRLAMISPGEALHLRDDAAIDWLQNWYLVRETGVALRGPGAVEVVPPIEFAEFVTATARYAREVSRRPIADASPGALAYSVLTMCRALLTVQTQSRRSKQEAAAWVGQLMPEWAWLIEAALRCRLSRGTLGFDDEGTRTAAAELIRLLATRIAAEAPAA